MKTDFQCLSDVATLLRTSAYATILRAGTGHLGACGSSAELLTCLYFGGILRYSKDYPAHPARDRVYVRGHVGPLRYSLFSILGWVEPDELHTYRKLGSRLKGHECMLSGVSGIDITPSGSLGMLLSYAAGAALVTRSDGLSSKHFVFLGDGEEQEGNISEAARHIVQVGLSDVICILDSNKKQLSRPTAHADGSTDLAALWRAYGWQALEIDGHDVASIIAAYKQATLSSRPTFIVAHTVKGRGLVGAEDHFNGYHTLSACPDKTVVSTAVAQYPKAAYLRETCTSMISPSVWTPPEGYGTTEVAEPKRYSIKIEADPAGVTNLDAAQGHYFAQLMHESRAQGMPLYFMTPDLIYDADVKAIGLDKCAAFIDTGLREQHTIAMAHGIAQTNRNARIFINYFDAFVYRASDQLHAAAQGKSRMLVLSELSGLTQGTNGKTHQAPGVSAVPLFMPDVMFFEPCDVQDMYNVLNYYFSENPGLVVVRTHRADIAPLPRTEWNEHNIDFYVVFDTNKTPDIVLVGSGFVVHYLVELARLLVGEHVAARVINVINFKAMKRPDFVNMLADGRPVLTVYNGSANLLQSLVSAAVMESSSIRPSGIKGHGFESGDTGSVTDLIRHYKMDATGLRTVLRDAFGI